MSNSSQHSNQISDCSNQPDRIRITVKLFAAFQEAVCKSEIELDLPAQSPVSAVYKVLATNYPSLDRWQAVTRYAINLNFSDENTILQNGDEVALIPPVSGG